LEKNGMKNMKNIIGGRAIVISIAAGTLLFAATTAEETNNRLRDSATVLSEVTSAPDKSIPRDLIERSKCIVIVPGMKQGAFIVGAKYGKGFISCRGSNDGKWSAPGAVRVEGGSVGFQIGGSETDVVMLVMNDNGAKKLLESKFTLGAEGEVAAGPVGRNTSANTDAKMTAEILSWSRSHGVFAGVSLQGATLREDLDDNQAMYGERFSNHEIVTRPHEKSAAASELVSMLDRYSPTKEK
jgi:lipid-binding SYLF domain-containing protein